MVRFIQGFVQDRPSRAAQVAFQSRTSVAAAVTVAAAVATAPPAFAQSGNTASTAKSDAALAHVLQAAQPDTRGWTSVIVQLAPGTTSTNAEQAVTPPGRRCGSAPGHHPKRRRSHSHQKPAKTDALGLCRPRFVRC